MKKVLFIVLIMFVSLCCTACINNFAIQELNQTGLEYLKKGDYDNAIARFKSSVDLDESVFESRYNLAVAYIEKKEFKEGIENLKIALQLKPDSKDGIYSLAVAQESLAQTYLDGVPADDDSQVEPSASDKKEAILLYKDSVSNYEEYLKYLPEGNKETETQKMHIESLNSTIDSLEDELKTSDADKNEAPKH